MKKITLLLALSFVGFSEDIKKPEDRPQKTLSDNTKLAIKDAQIRLLKSQIEYNRIQQIQQEFYQASAGLNAAVAVAEKQCGTRIAEDLTCTTIPIETPEGGVKPKADKPAATAPKK